MLDVLNKHLQSPFYKGCTVDRWINSLPQEEQEAFAQVKENNKAVKIALLYKELILESPLPFQLTAFRSHLRGYCTCQKK